MHDLDGGTPLPERHDRSENRVFYDPGKKLYGPRARDHGLEKKALEGRAVLTRSIMAPASCLTRSALPRLSATPAQDLEPSQPG